MGASRRSTQAASIVLLAGLFACDPKEGDYEIHVTNAAWPCPAHVMLDDREIGVVRDPDATLRVHGAPRWELPFQAQIETPDGLFSAKIEAAHEMPSAERAAWGKGRAAELFTKVEAALPGPTLLFHDGGQPVDMAIGKLSGKVGGKPGRNVVTMRLPALKAPTPLLLNGQSAGVLPLSGVLLVDPTGARCYRIELISYARSDAQAVPAAPTHLGPALLHPLAKVPDFLLAGPDAVVQATRGESLALRTALDEEPCPKSPSK
jgi:hypothetical protein